MPSCAIIENGLKLCLDHHGYSRLFRAKLGPASCGTCLRHGGTPNDWRANIVRRGVCQRQSRNYHSSALSTSAPAFTILAPCVATATGLQAQPRDPCRAPPEGYFAREADRARPGRVNDAQALPAPLHPRGRRTIRRERYKTTKFLSFATAIRGPYAELWRLRLCSFLTLIPFGRILHRDFRAMRPG